MNTPDSNAFTGHTEGTWTISGPYINAIDANGQLIRMDSIAKVFPYEGGVLNAETRANLRLIAAAPTLLAERDELKAALEWCIHQFEGDSGTGASHWEQYAEYVAAKALLSRLNGKATP